MMACTLQRPMVKPSLIHFPEHSYTETAWSLDLS